MMRRLLLAALLAFAPSFALAQNVIGSGIAGDVKVGGCATGVRSFTTPGVNTFTMPPGCDHFNAYALGAGGKGGDGTIGGNGGAGGSAGAYVSMATAISLSAGSVIHITIGTDAPGTYQGLKTCVDWSAGASACPTGTGMNCRVAPSGGNASLREVADCATDSVGTTAGGVGYSGYSGGGIDGE